MLGAEGPVGIANAPSDATAPSNTHTIPPALAAGDESGKPGPVADWGYGSAPGVAGGLSMC